LPNNLPSQKVAQRLGMTIDGRAELHGHWHDVWVGR
jgi:RimJ/RimL family protein N-acetyltransferase